MKNVSDEQCDAIEQQGKFVLLACPGSGKTFTVAHRLAKRLKEQNFSHAGIATLSFTNVAHEEISQQLQQLGCPAMPPYPHFLGTIDHFINTWIFLPFGHLVMKCDGRPEIKGFQGNTWNPTGYEWSWKKKECHKCDLLDFSFDIHGELINVNSEKKLKNCPHNFSVCRQLKERFRRKGFATQTDANYWAMKILEIYPRVAKALARRFPEIIIDEAQDSSDIQMRIFDLLVEHGLSEIMLVGDPDQAIYEWRDAKPEVFVEKVHAEGWKKATYLTENRRSSQHICNATYGFASYLPDVAMAVGDDASYEMQPKMIEYDPKEFETLTNTFITICHECDLIPSPQKTAILVSTNRILRKILGIRHKKVDPWNHDITRLLAQAAYHYHQRHAPKQALSSIQTIAIQLYFDNVHLSRRELEKQINSTMGVSRLWQLVKRLPHPDLQLSAWISHAKGVFQNWIEENGWPVLDEEDTFLKVKQGIGKHKDKKFLTWPVSTFFTEVSSERENVRIETVYAAKGKTYEAVLFVVSDSRSKKGTAKQLAGSDEDEEIRTAYVAMTRPRKLLVVAIPQGTKRESLWRFPEWMKPELPTQAASQLSIFS